MSDPNAPKGKGCFFYGCLTLVVLALLAVGGIYFGFQYVVGKFVAQYTDTAPMALQKVEATPAEATTVQERVKAFRTALNGGTATEPLVLNEKELNMLLAFDPNLKDIKDKVYLSIQGDQLKGQLSLPLDRFNVSRLHGRYLNGSAALKASMENGVLIVTIQSLQVKGAAIPEQMIAKLRNENLAKDAYSNPTNAEFLRKIESFGIGDGRITIKARVPK